MNRAKIVAEIHRLKEEQKAAKAREDELWDLLEISGPQEPEVFEDYILKVTERSTWNEKTALRNLDPETLAKVSKMKPDLALAKATLDEDTYKILCCNQSITRTIELVKDN